VLNRSESRLRGNVMGLCGVSDGDPYEIPAGATIKPATKAEIRRYREAHADHGCEGAPPVWRGNVLTGYYPGCPYE
ncbi:MAG: hypothetical protein ACRDRT_12705, partial [Pseudonocardiaceae bacterium]